ncbi:hypothetical protein [Ralstonia sp. SET104]|uniref:hypothetical protein n=1 Tax=Ralstonia sp. SET104 TaxID=2448774 RepID=UPI000F56B221|nr:hypothetical protein [Ralstonia sp. SET104]GCB02849.1 hypothetical protein PSUB009319_04800 [Ralstonia sp. SET104]
MVRNTPQRHLGAAVHQQEMEGRGVHCVNRTIGLHESETAGTPGHSPDVISIIQRRAASANTYANPSVVQH